MKRQRTLSAVNSVVSVVLTDALAPDNPITYVNRAFELLTGYSAAQVMGRNCRFLQGEATDPVALSEIRAAVAAGGSIRREILNYRQDGTSFWNELAIDPLHDESGTLTGFVAVQHDVSDKHAAQVRQTELEARLAATLDALPGFLFELSADAGMHPQTAYVSPSAKRVLGLRGTDPVGFDDLLRWMPDRDRERLHAAIAQAARIDAVQHMEFRIQPPSGSEAWFRAAISMRLQPDGSTTMCGLALDVTEDRSTRLQAAYLATNDPLTKLLNRHMLRTRIAEAVVSLNPELRETVLLIADLDEFGALNDTLGMPAGDRVLRRIGMRVAEFAEQRNGLAGRFGGDEFTAMLPNPVDGPSVAELTAAFRQTFSDPVRLDGQDIAVTVCIGVASLPALSEPSQAAAGEERAEELLKRAQIALLLAKRTGSASARIYTPDVDDRFRHHQALRRSLQRAITEEQFQLHYQPQVMLETGAIVGLEALVRWDHPEFGLQRPDVFIPMAEQSGQIVPLGALLMRIAMQQQRVWVRRGMKVPVVSINVSGVQLRQPGFVEMVQQTLDQTGARPEDFELELTETTLLDGEFDIARQLAQLRTLGFSLAIDDFGAGHATLRYLREFPVDRLKIDQSFIRHLVLGSSDVEIVKSMVGLGAALGIKVVAEGIETAAQRDFLLECGCTVGQGYLFSMPLAAEDMGWMLRERLSLPMPASIAEETL